MRSAVALAAAVALAGCAGPLFPKAWLDAHDAAKIGESIAVRFTLTNAQTANDLTVHRPEFKLQGGTGMFTCTNRAGVWALLDSRGETERILVEPAGKLDGYLEFALCPDVAGPYTLLWDGRESARDDVDVRILDSDAPLAPIEILAHSLNETARLR